MNVHLQTTEAKNNFVRKERKMREEKQDIFASLRPSRSSRFGVFASVFAWRRNKSNDGPQMISNDHKYSAFHLRSSRFSRTSAFAFDLLIGEQA